MGGQEKTRLVKGIGEVRHALGCPGESETTWVGLVRHQVGSGCPVV